MKNTARRSIVVASLGFVVALLAGAHADAAETGETYAVVSMVGDAISIVRYQVATGSSLDQNARQQLPTPDRHFDQLATRVAIAAIHRGDPSATAQRVDLADYARFADVDTPDAADAALPSLLAAVQPLLAQPAPHYLVVIGKFRGDARLRVRSGTIGSGKLAGIGFYIDSYKRLRNSATGETGRGFVAPYAYVQVSLIDLGTGTLVRRTTAEVSSTRANIVEDATFDPWDSLTAEQKSRLLDGMLVRAVQNAVPRVTSPT